MATDPTAELRAEVDRLVAAAREGDRAAFDEPVDVSIEGQPEAAAESAIGLEDLARAVAALPPKLRSTVVLKDVYGLSHEAIAEDLGISVVAARVRVHRGRKRLRDVLFEEGGRS